VRGQAEDEADAWYRAQGTLFTAVRVRSDDPAFHLPNLLLDGSPDPEMGKDREADGRLGKRLPDRVIR